MKYSPIRLILFLLAALILSACGPGATPTAGFERGFSFIWYVATTGDDSNACDAPEAPCATVAAALLKAYNETTRTEAAYSGETISVFHTIHVGAGSYMVTAPHGGEPFARVILNVSIIGAGQEQTFFDAGDLYGGIYVNGEIRVTLRDFTVSNANGSAPDSCINIRGAAEVSIENVAVRNCLRTGVTNLGTGLVTLENVTAANTRIEDPYGYGYGVFNAGTMIINGGLFTANQGSGISSRGDLTMTDGVVELSGREGVQVSGIASFDGLQVLNNGTDGSFRAGISMIHEGTARFTGALVSGNQIGAWVNAEGAVLYLTDSIVRDHPRTGLIVSEGELRLTNTLVQNNASTYTGTSLGGGLSVEAGGRAILRESQIIANANGGIVNDGELFLVESSITENVSGMPPLYNGPEATAIIERSLIASNLLVSPVTGNQSVDNRGTMNMVNSTISDNQGMGIVNFGALNLAYSTIAFNVMDGFTSIDSGPSPWLSSNIIAGNGRDCYPPTSSNSATFTLNGHNIDSDGTCDFPQTATIAELMLDVLADNGGPTFTHALLPGSPAIDAVSIGCPPEDQRLSTRPFGLRCDVGAFEAGGVALSLDLDATPTASSLTLIAIPDQNYNCRYGNGTTFDIADTLFEGQEYSPIGVGPDKQWLQFSGPSFGEKCWAPGNGFTLLLNGNELPLADLPVDLLPLVSYPAAPTATPDPDEGNNASQPDAPSGLQASEAQCSPNGYQVSLSWDDNSDNEDGFYIYHNGQLVATVGVDVQKYTHSVPMPWNQQQNYVVAAYNSAGSASSSSASENGCK